MTEKTIYISFDGIEFEDENECLDYEAMQETKDYHWTWFSDFSGTRLAPNLRNVEDVVAVILTSEKEYETMTNWLYEESYDTDGLREYKGEGLYYYDDGCDCCWKYWPEEVRKMIAFGAAFGQTI